MASSGKGHRDGVEITAIGVLYKGPLEKKYWSSSRGKEKYPYPIGYQATRCHGGHSYSMEVSEGPRGPLFAVTCEEGIACSGQTPSVPWEDILKKRHAGVKKILMRSSSASVDGPEMFGFTNPLVQRLCRDLVVSASGLAERSAVEVVSKGKGGSVDVAAVESGKSGILAESSGKSLPKARREKKLIISNDDKSMEQDSYRTNMDVKGLQAKRYGKQLGEHGKRRHAIQDSGKEKMKRVSKGNEEKLKDLEGAVSKSAVLIKPELSLEARVNLVFGVSEDEEVPRHNIRIKRPRSSRPKGGNFPEEDVELDRTAQTSTAVTESGSETITIVNVVSTRKKRLKGQDNLAEQAAKSPHPISLQQFAAIDVDVVEDSVSPEPEKGEVTTAVSVKDGERRIGSQNGSTLSQTTDTLDSAAVDEALPKNASGKKKRLKLAKPDKASSLPLTRPEKTQPLPLAKPEMAPPLPLAKAEKTPSLPLAKVEKMAPLPLARPEMTSPPLLIEPEKALSLVLLNPEQTPHPVEYEKYGTNVDLIQSEGVLSIDLMCPSVDDLRSSEANSCGADVHPTPKDSVSSAQQNGVFLLLEACKLTSDKDGPSHNTSSRDKGDIDVKRKRTTSDRCSVPDMNSPNEFSPVVSKSPRLCKEDLKINPPGQTIESPLSCCGHPTEAQDLEGEDITQGRFDSPSIGSSMVGQDTVLVELLPTGLPPLSIQVVKSGPDGAQCMKQETSPPTVVKCFTVPPESISNGNHSLEKEEENKAPSTVENSESAICLNSSMPSGPMRTVYGAPTARRTELKLGINTPFLLSSSKGWSFTNLKPSSPGVGKDMVDESLGTTVCIVPKDKGIDAFHSDRTGDYHSYLIDSSSSVPVTDYSTDQLQTTVKDIGFPCVIPARNVVSANADSGGVISSSYLCLPNQERQLEVEEITIEPPARPKNHAVLSEYEGGYSIHRVEFADSILSTKEGKKQLSLPVILPSGVQVVSTVASDVEVTSGEAVSSMAVMCPPIDEVICQADPRILPTAENVLKKHSVVEVPSLPVVLPTVVEVGDPDIKVTAEYIPDKTVVAEVPSTLVVLPSVVELVIEVNPDTKVVAETILDKASMSDASSLPVVLPSGFEAIRKVVPAENVKAKYVPEQTCVANSPTQSGVLSVKENKHGTQVSIGKIVEHGAVTGLSFCNQADLQMDTLQNDLGIKVTPGNAPEKVCQAESVSLPLTVEEIEPDTATSFGKIMEHGVVTVLSPSYQVDLFTDMLSDDLDAMATPENVPLKSCEAEVSSPPLAVSVKENEPHTAVIFGKSMENGVVTSSYPMYLLTNTRPDVVSHGASQLGESVTVDGKMLNDSLEVVVTSSGAQVIDVEASTRASPGRAMQDLKEQEVSSFVAAVKETESGKEVSFGKINEHSVTTVLAPCDEVDLLTDTVPEDEPMTQTFWNVSSKESCTPTLKEIRDVMLISSEESVRGTIDDKSIVDCPSFCLPVSQELDTTANTRLEAEQVVEVDQSHLDEQLQFSASVDQPVMAAKVSLMGNDHNRQTEEHQMRLIGEQPALAVSVPDEESMEVVGPVKNIPQGDLHVTVILSNELGKAISDGRVSDGYVSLPSPPSQKFTTITNAVTEAEHVVEEGQSHLVKELLSCVCAVQSVKIERLSAIGEGETANGDWRQHEEFRSSFLSKHPKVTDTVGQEDPMTQAICHDPLYEAFSCPTKKDASQSEEDATLISSNDPVSEIIGTNLSVDCMIHPSPPGEKLDTVATNVSEAEEVLDNVVSGHLVTEVPVIENIVSPTRKGPVSNEKNRLPKQHQKRRLSEHQVDNNELTAIGLEEHADIMKAGLDSLSSSENELDLKQEVIPDAAVTNTEEGSANVEITVDLPSQFQLTVSSQEHNQKDESNSMRRELTKSMLTLLLPQAVPLLTTGVRFEKQFLPDNCNDEKLEEQIVPPEEKTGMGVFSHDQNKIPLSFDMLSKASDFEVGEGENEGENVDVLSVMAANCSNREVEMLSTISGCSSCVAVLQSTTGALGGLGVEVSSAVPDPEVSKVYQEASLTETTLQVISVQQVSVLPKLDSLPTRDRQIQDINVTKQPMNTQLDEEDQNQSIDRTCDHVYENSGQPQVGDACSPLIPASVHDLNEVGVRFGTLEKTAGEEPGISLEVTMMKGIAAAIPSQDTSNSILDPKGVEIRPEEQIAPVPSSGATLICNTEHTDGQALNLQPDWQSNGRKSTEITGLEEAALIVQSGTAALVERTVDIHCPRMEEGFLVDSKTEEVSLAYQNSHACGVQVAAMVSVSPDSEENRSASAIDLKHRSSYAQTAKLNISSGNGSLLIDNALGRVEVSFSIPPIASKLQEHVKDLGHVDSGNHPLKGILDYEGLPSTVKQLNDSKKMESALCLDHSLPVSAVVLNVRGDEVRLCVVCGTADVKERTFFVYQVFYRGNDDEIKPQLLCTMNCTCEKSDYGGFNLEIPMEESAIRFSPDGQHLVVLDCFKLPESWFASRYFSHPVACLQDECGVDVVYSNLNNHDGHGVNILSFEKEVFGVSEHLQSEDLMHCLTVPGPQLLIAAGDNGCINCWEMDSGWRTCKDRFSLPRATCDGAPFMSVTKLSVKPGSPHMVLGCDYGGSFAVWDTQSRTLLSSCHLPNHKVLKATWLDITTINLEQSEVWGKYQSEVHSQEIATADSLSGLPLLCLLTMVSSEGGSTLEDQEEGAMKCQEDARETDIEWSCKTVILKSNGILCGPGLPDRASAVTSLGLYGVMGTTGGLVQFWEVMSGRKICELNELAGSSIVTLVTNPSSAVLATANGNGQVVLYFEKDDFAVSVR